MHWLISEPIELEKIAEILIAQFSKGGALGFEGPLGVGKTTLIKEIVKNFCLSNKIAIPRVTSPSFVVHQLYETKPPIHHFDFYRLELANPDSLIEIGYWEAWEATRQNQALLFVEWPSHSKKVDLKLDAVIQMDFKSDKRQIDLKLFPRKKG